MQYINEANEIAKFTGIIDIIQDDKYIPQTPYLLLNEHGLAICYANFKPLYINNIYANLEKRKNNLSQELLIQALKIKNKSKDQVTILDVTAGFGKDATLIANYGYAVIMLEQNPILATIIQYAISKNYINGNVKIIYMDSIEYLEHIITSNQTTKIDAIYLDPMFEENNRSKSKKDMQIIQMLVKSQEIDSSKDDKLLRLSLKITQKAVVKRDNKQTPLVDKPKPSHSKTGKTVRYDIYVGDVT